MILKTINFIIIILVCVNYAIKIYEDQKIKNVALLFTEEIYKTNEKIKDLEEKGKVLCFTVFIGTSLESVICSKKILFGTWKFD